MKGVHVCRHSDGGTAVPADQFGEQTYIRRGMGAGGLRGISTNAEQIAVWVGIFSVCAHLDLAIEARYCHEDAGRSHLRENATRGTNTKRNVKDVGIWTRKTAMRLQRSCKSARTLSM